MRKHIRRSAAIFAIVVLGLAPAQRPVRGDSWRVSVRGGEIELGESPVVVELKVPLPVGNYVMEATAGGGAIPAQVFEDRGKRYLGAILTGIAARQTASFTLKGPTTDAATTEPGLSFETHGRNLKVMLDQKLLTEYHLGVGNKPFFFPLIGPTGESYTRTFPMEVLPEEDHDHPHQRSSWFTHGNVNGVDFWSEGNRFGTIKETGRTIAVAGRVIGRLSTSNEWRAADDRKICADERTVTFYRTKAARIIDFDFRIRATEGPVTFFDTKEGTFGIRVASSMDVTKKTGGKITNAEGLTNEKAWGKASQWVDYVGPVKDKTVGIAIINHPGSFRYPTTWHVRTYGLFAANPFGWHDFGQPKKGDYTIADGQSVEFSYRVVLHEGDTTSANVPALAAAYSLPPVVEVQKD